MNKIKLLIVLLLLAITNSNAQLVTLDYGSFTSSSCDAFSPLTTVQNIFHETKRGDIAKSSSQGGLELKYVYNGGWTNQKGAEFSLSGINFKANHKYTIKITAKNNGNYSEPAGLKCNFNTGQIDPGCNNVNTVNPNNNTFGVGGVWFQNVNGTAFQEYTFTSDALITSLSGLGIGTFSRFNIASPSNFSQTIYIKKIVITEIPPPPSFTFTPTSLSLACGDTAARTFTVTPSNIPAGAVVTYNWSAPGWTQVGSTTNPRSYQPTSGSVLPSPITVTPIINGVAQPTKTCTVTRQAFASNSVISGANNLCTSATYTSNIVGATTFSWAITQGADKVTLAGNGTPSVTLTALPNASGMVTLSLTAGNACGSVTRTKSIQIGATSITTNNMVGPIAVYYNEIHNYYYAGQVPNSPSSTYNWFIYNGINDGVGPECGGQILSGQGSRNINLETGCNTGFLIVEITAKNCEIEETAFLYVDVSNPFARLAATTSTSTITTFPNPMTESSNLQVDVIKTGTTDTINDFSKIKVAPKAIDNQVKVYDFYGNLKYSTNFKSDKMSLNNLNLKSGKYILNVTTNSGEQLKTVIFVK